ncbi:MAG: hypothetical protein WBD09_09165 [Halobacteriota archaeon]
MYQEFGIEEFTAYWNVDEEKFKAKIKNYENILIAGFPPMCNIIKLSKELCVKELYTVGVIMPAQEPFRKMKEEVEARIREQREKETYRGECVGTEPSQYMYG